MAKRPDLMITTGKLAGQRFSVGTDGLRLGRSSSNDIRILDERLSRNHCFFEAAGEEGLRLTDLASANGTFLNGQLMDGDSAVLHVGDIVEIGSTSIRVVGEQGNPSAGAADSGLGGAARQPEVVKRRWPFAKLLWLLALVLAGSSIYLALMWSSDEGVAVPIAVVEEEPVLAEPSCEMKEVLPDDKDLLPQEAKPAGAEGTHDGIVRDVTPPKVTDVPQVTEAPKVADAPKELSGVVGRLEVRTCPSGARVFVDGRLVGITESKDPSAEFSDILTIENLMAGEHTLVLKKRGYQDRALHPKIQGEETVRYHKQRLVRIFTPNVEIVTSRGTYRGVFVSSEREAVVVEVSPGITQSFPRSEIRNIDFLKNKRTK